MPHQTFATRPRGTHRKVRPTPAVALKQLLWIKAALGDVLLTQRSPLFPGFCWRQRAPPAMINTKTKANHYNDIHMLQNSETRLTNQWDPLCQKTAHMTTTSECEEPTGGFWREKRSNLQVLVVNKQYSHYIISEVDLMLIDSWWNQYHWSPLTSWLMNWEFFSSIRRQK